jgi:hypothetical protein
VVLFDYGIGGFGDVPVVELGIVVEAPGVVRLVPLLGRQLMVTPLPAVGAAPAAAAVPTCDGAGVTAVGCAAVVVGAAAVVVPVGLDCGTVPAGHGVVPEPSPPTLEVAPAPGEVPGMAVVFVPGVVVAPGVAVVFAPGVVVAAPGDVPGIAVVFIPGVTPG